MEENVVTSSGSPRTPVTTTTTGGILPPLPPSSVKTTIVLTPSTSGSDPIPLTTSTIVSFTHNETCDPFSYGMPNFDTNTILSYSTLQAMGLGAGSSKTPLKGSTASTTLPFNSIPYGWGHIPPPSPSLGGAF
jgi:hypothetical protein